MDDDDRITGAEVQMAREYLGLTTRALAGILGVREDTLRKWEAGREPVPMRVDDELGVIEDATQRSVDELVMALNDARDPTVLIYRTDAQFRAQRGDAGDLTARWWRHVVARACYRVSGVRVENE